MLHALTPPTYYADVKPIVDGRCVGCHTAGGPAPFPLSTYEQVFAHKEQIAEAVGDLVMPPWLTTDSCTEYTNDRSLTQSQIHTVVDWAESGGPAGDPAAIGASLPPVGQQLSRADLKLGMARPYEPQLKPDEYRCFVLDWPADAPRYITGFGVDPGNHAIVHHAVVYVIEPESVPQLQALDGADGRPGYTCFGDAGVTDARWLGAWAPGMSGYDMPDGTGLPVPAGSKIVLQIHYHWPHAATAGGRYGTDQSQVTLKLAPAVDKPAQFQLVVDPTWLNDPAAMKIPAGHGDVEHSFEADYGSAVGHGKPVTVWGAFFHMHQLGRSGGLEIVRKDGTHQCVVDIPKWDFNWQLDYWLKQPQVLQPGDHLRIDCHWDNSAGNQPVVDGVRQPPRDVTWGNGSNDEMCLAAVYMSVGP